MRAALELPPAYRAVVLREHRDAQQHARHIADEAGAGTLVWVRRFDTAELAVVLEPEEPLAAARRAVYALMNAAGDALATHCPPERPLAFAWPDTVLLDGGILGGVRLDWPAGAVEDEPPAWLVGGLTLRLVLPAVSRRQGAAHPLDVQVQRGTSLEIEGFEMLDAEQLIGSVARHLMVQVHRWQEDGFASVGAQFLARLAAGEMAEAAIADNGDLISRAGAATGTATGAVRRSLVEALATPQWLDPDSGEPWL